MSSPPPFLSAHSLQLFLLQVGVLLLLALLLGRLAARLRMPALVGELMAGVIMGPSLFQHFLPGAADWLFPRDTQQIAMLDAVGQIGVLLLVGVTGAGVDLSLARARAPAAAWVSGFGLVIPLGLGVLTGFLLPGSVTGADGSAVFPMFLGVAMCVSAVPVIAKILLDMDLLGHKVGQLAVTAAVLDDVFGWFMLSLVSAMASNQFNGSAVTKSALSLVAVVVVTMVIAKVCSRVTKARAARTRRDRPVLGAALIVSLVLLSASATHALGLEALLGAFLCGLLISRFASSTGRGLTVLRSIVLSVFAPVFFATAGLRMDLTSLADWDVLAVAMIILTLAVVGKFAGAFLGARIAKLSAWEGLALGAGMNARGVVEIMVAMVGLRLGVLNTEMYTIIVLIALVTSLMAPPVLRVAMNRVSSLDQAVAPTGKPTESFLGREP